MIFRLMLHSELGEVEVDCGGAGSEHSDLSQEIYLSFFSLKHSSRLFYLFENKKFEMPDIKLFCQSQEGG